MDVKFKTPSLSIGFKSERVYPELEDLEVTPTAEEQNFKSSKYGFDNVKVNRIETEALEITPTIEAQKHTGLYDTVNVKGIETEELNIKPTEEEQVYDGLYNKVTVAGVSTGGGVKITDASYLFYHGARLDNLQEILAMCKGLTDTSYMFNSCQSLTELDLSMLDTSNVDDMSSMFGTCQYLTSLNLTGFDTSKVIKMNNMFSTCSSLTSLILNFNTGKVDSMSSMFASCSQLVDLDISSFDASKVTSVSSILHNCAKLTNLKFVKNLGKKFTTKTANYSSYKLDLSRDTSLTHDSLMDVINNLYDLNLTYNVANGGTLYRQSLTLGATNLAKLTEEEIAIATNKGWNVT